MKTDMFNKKMARWKNNLIDISKRNRLINFKDSVASTVKFKTDVDGLYHTLSDDKAIKVSSIVDLQKFIDKEKRARKKKMDFDEDDAYEFLDIEHFAIEKLEKSLQTIRLKAKSSIDEKGVNTLFLSFGQLIWKESRDSKIELRSPLLLLPVTLWRERSDKPYFMQRNDDELTINPTLGLKLKNDFGIILPTLYEQDKEIQITDYIKEVSESIKEHVDWSITEDIYLGFFSFNKLVMYKDLEQYSSEISQHQIVQQLAGVLNENEHFSNETEMSINEYDRISKSIDTFQILDADSSQQEAILAANNGKNFIISGPPGTGKSQTISNIISESLALGKRVLFVSEKKAALEVVKKRLDSRKLGDFCLELHSNNTNKKVFLSELDRTLLQRGTSQLSIFNFDTFDKVKKQLNDYTEALHTPVSPLGLSAYRVHGELSKLDKVDDLIFSIEKTGSVSQNELVEIHDLLERLRIYSHLLHDSESHLWKGSIVRKFTLELQSDISVKFQRLSHAMKRIDGEFTLISKNIELNWSTTFENYDRLKKLNVLLKSAKKVPENWLINDHKLLKASDFYKEVRQKFEGHQQIKELIIPNYNEDIWNLDIDKLISRVESFKSILDVNIHQNSNYLNELCNGSQKSYIELSEFYNATCEIQRVKTEISDLLSMDIETVTYNQVVNFQIILEKIRANLSPTEFWFEVELYTKLRETFTTAQANIKEYIEDLQKFNEKYDQQLLERDELTSMLERFMMKYTNPLRFFNKSYRNDKKIIRFYLKSNLKLNHEELLFDVKLFDRLSKRKKWLEVEDEHLRSWLGEHYKGINTNWIELLEQIDQTELLVNSIISQGLSVSNFKELILTMNTFKLDNIGSMSNKLNRSLLVMQDKFIDIKSLVNKSDINELESSLDNEFLSIIKLVLNTSKLFLEEKKNLNDYSLKDSYTNYNHIMSDLKQLQEYKKSHLELQDQFEVYTDSFESLFKGFETNWLEIADSIDWVRNLKDIIKESIPTVIMNEIRIREDFVSSSLDRTIDNIEKIFEENNSLLKFYYSIFPEEAVIYSGKSIYETGFNECIEQLSIWATESYKLEEWTAIQTILSDAEKLGIEDFIKEIKLMKSSENIDYKTLFMKRFYKVWLDCTYELLPILSNFDVSQHNKLISQFKSLDKNQLDINSARVYKILNYKKEECLTNYNFTQQLGVLKREISKKTRHKPIRKLFDEIPDVLFALKPCMMMSPMSVSQFIDPNVIKFDTVIFDEASQLCTEDAIGSIFRGKQIIIAGDKKQLPPTSFFGAAFEEDEEFIDEDDESNDTYESVLDEASIFMTVKPLLWHYRSKHESLIAFSNQEIYENKLYTFPSSSNNSNDGISLVYVPDGMYERSTSRRNIIEAKTVANLVFEHIKTTPSRSLGVIAFSEAQQQAILDQIYALRKHYNNSVVESFFDDSKSDYFFVKNLENVQGDERDTIFFSIGYGKDSNGTIHYNFGPLNKPGGERRLNVAITRAKYEIKLVSSMLYSDLDDAKLTKKGPQLLKSYLYYASTGGELSPNSGIQNNGEFDSPFEEDVYEALTAEGFIVRKQVGCSSYRIDLAVVDSKNPGKYLLGIECDGATYHSSKTARDRDRLRQEILETLGWKIHRIWSQDWFRRKKDEVTRVTSLLKSLNNQ